MRHINKTFDVFVEPQEWLAIVEDFLIQDGGVWVTKKIWIMPAMILLKWWQFDSDNAE